MVPGEPGQLGDILPRSWYEPAFTKLQLDDDRRNGPRGYRRGKCLLQACPACKATSSGFGALPCLTVTAPVAIGERDPVDLGSKGTKAFLVRIHLRRKRHGQVGSAMEAMLEAHHGWPAGEMPRNLDRIFHRLGAAIEQDRSLRVITRCHPIQTFSQHHVRFIGGHWKADVGVALELLPNRADHGCMPVAGVHHPDSTAKIDQPVSVHIGDNRALCMGQSNGGHRGNAARYCPRPALQESTAAGAGDFGLKVNNSGHRVRPGWTYRSGWNRSLSQA